MPAGLLCYGVYICFAEMPDDWMVQTVSGGKWTDVAVPDEGYYHIFVSLCGVDEMRIIAKYDKSYQKLSINEIYFFSYGDVPAWVQRWEPTPTDADIMFLVAHPDDELLFMGGAIPTYATEQQRKVVVAYMTHSNATRRSELLNGLWKMGVHTYPVIGNFWDTYTTTLSESEKKWDKNKALLYVIELYRKYKPKVVVTHDFNGEYGHGMHKLTAELAELAYNQAADPEQDTESAEQYGVWQVKKLYSHLYEHNQIVFDWDVPLQSMDGKTSLELATEAYKLHITQQSTKLTMETTGVKYDNRVFGLVCSIVGEDVRHDDFLENILDSVTYVAAVTTPSVTPAPTPVASYTALMPKLNEDGFIDEGEFVYEDDDDNGIWIYVSQTLKVVIQRQFDPDTPLRWYEAEIWSDISAGEIFQTIYYDPEKKEKVRVDASETALKYGIVFAMNTDYYTYRLNSVRRKGIVIRDGEILLNDPYTSYTKAFPNLDTLALFPDGDMKVYTSNELTAQEYLDEGATDVLSFGPYLLRDRELNPETYVVSTTTNPRCAIGMVEPGHYAAILAEGRLSDSGGITVAYLGKLMRAMGCEVAFNLDGGQTAVMLFMGKQLNQIGAYDEKTNARATCEVIGIGSSSLVPSEKTEKD
ncbi:MAG: phosphodiester glycosidase family protein [Eubacteriales bacterium]|nr:phosphodiester glycosidase family protein [Eubacteriales bacterium]